jgi:hypothetical protein
VVGNTRHEVVEAQVAVDLRQMGLADGDVRAYNALSDRDIPLEDRKLQVRIRPTSFVLVQVDRN